ncbi:MAG: DNA-protecting protein DprA [Bacteroidales bacterium]|nr:DNA-protecting protein DprA [Bacteroidales bacterium]
MEDEKETLCLCALNRIFCYEPVVGLRLLEYFGTAAAVFEAPSGQLGGLLHARPEYAGKVHRGALAESARELESVERLGGRFVGLHSPAYPQLLRECPDRPLGLYVRSQTPVEDLFNSREAIAFVGTRDLSSYGREWCGNLVSTLSETSAKPLIVSGLAFGIDYVAHTTALTLSLPTVGVMATGIDRIYPSRHESLAERMVRTPGCALVSCYPLGTAPLANQFLSRNRIIAGMSRATVLVESKIRGGGLITARHAYSYDRDVYALPGRVDDVRSQGCNRLIRDKIAEPVISREDFLDKLGLKAPRLRKQDVLTRAAGLFPDGSLELAVLKDVLAERGIDIRTLCARTDRPYAEVIAAALALESEGFLSMDILQRCSVV